MDNPSLTPVTSRRLVRPTQDRKIGGVCSGIAAYLEIDPTVVRVAYALVSIFTGIVPGVLIYLVLMLIIPTAEAHGGAENR